MFNYDIDVDILVNGKPIKKLTHAGNIYVESKHWTEYSIRIKNNGWVRRLVVVSVDGINVINGQAAGPTKAGYVINGYSSTNIEGFRTSNEAVHPFKFNRQERSYAAKSEVSNGDTTNCGVIGVEVYDEKEQPVIKTKIVHHHHHHDKPYPVYPWRTYPMWNDYGTPVWNTTTIGEGGMRGGSTITYSCNTRSLSAMNCASNPPNSNLNSVKTCSMSVDIPDEEPKRGFDMGTEFSEREVESKVVDVKFDIGHLLTTISIYYASREGLEHMGVPVTKQTQISMPNPFPQGFCKPPKR